MSSGIIITGLAIAAAGFTGRYLLRNRQLIRKTITISDSGMFSKYYKGGFEKRMTRSEAALILGVPFNAKPEKVKEAHKRLMIINHPDRGGSPYIAMKINEAKDFIQEQR